MNRVQSVYNKTITILKLLKEQKDYSNHREDVLSQLNELILERETLMEDLAPPYTEEEKVIGKKIITLNQQLEEEMGILVNYIKDDMKKMKQHRELNYTYIRPYGKPKTIDGMYVDNKLYISYLNQFHKAIIRLKTRTI